MTELQDLLNKLSPQQLNFVAARLDTKTDKEAADIAGIPVATVYSWANKVDVDRAVNLAKQDILAVARARLQQNVNQAVDTLIAGLKQKKGLTALRSACEILDRAGLVKGSSLDITSQGGRIGREDTYTWDQRIAVFAQIVEMAQAEEEARQSGTPEELAIAKAERAAATKKFEARYSS